MLPRDASVLCSPHVKRTPRVILLGHRGFVGSALASNLRQQGADVLGVDRDNYRSSRGAEADLLINANGSSDKRLAERDPLASFRANVDTLVESLSDFRYERYVLMSSIDVYNDFGDPARNDEDVAIDPLRLSRYGLIKYMAELAVRSIARSWLILRLGPLVGPQLKKNPIHDLLSERTLYISPESRLSFIDTRDVAKTAWALRTEDGVFNVAGFGTVRLADVATAAGVDVSGIVEALPVHTYSVNIDKLRARMRVRSSEDAVKTYLAERQGLSSDASGEGRVV